MPYNPQITDQSGMFLAQGRLAGGMAALGGISQGIQTYQKNRLQNQILSSENEALIAGLQQLQQMNVPGVAQMAPPGMDKLIQKHLEGGGLNLNDAMKLNAMLGTTLKTAQTTQAMQAQATQRELQNRALSAQIAEGKQAAQDIEGLSTILKELQGQELTQEGFISAASKANISPRALESFSGSLARMAPKREAMGSTTQQLAVKLRAAAEQKLGRPLTAQEDADLMIQAANATRAPGPAAPETTEQKLDAERASKALDKFNQGFEDSYAAEQSADLIISALNSGAKGGVFAPLRTTFSKVLGLDDATQQELLKKGVAGLTAVQARKLAAGLGSMSNADREFFVSSLPDFTDTDLANRFYAEMAIENAKFAREDEELRDQMKADGKSTQEVVSELERRRRSRKVGAIVRDRVLGQPKTAAGGPSTTASQQPATGARVRVYDPATQTLK